MALISCGVMWILAWSIVLCGRQVPRVGGCWRWAEMGAAPAVFTHSRARLRFAGGLRIRGLHQGLRANAADG